jgi:hypothetical protein
MNNWCICWFFMHILLGILIVKGLTERCLYKSFGVKGLNFKLKPNQVLFLQFSCFLSK